jgi:serine/threonine protein kinase
MDKYEFVKKLGSGNFGVTNLMRHKETGEHVAVKQMERGSKINKNVYREVINHRKLSHPNVIGFKEVQLDDKYINIVMEYASGARTCRSRVCDCWRLCCGTRRGAPHPPQRPP